MDVSRSKPKVAEFRMVVAACGDLARSRDFYHDLFGLSVTMDHAPHWIELDLGNGTSLGLHPATGNFSVQPGSVQLGFTVPNVDRFVTDARTMGTRILQEPFDASFGRLAIIGDPDGYAIQVYTPRR
ncbi:MAG: VOC family protein [Candidatus Eremiobacteraeota bacterium]|nr:VOC family protein [Candidatus Eremiobacteraeota bacterium]MBV8355956.1 VOC family protein [Candidatus Eremiobacteraeota bacterium]